MTHNIASVSCSLSRVVVALSCCIYWVNYVQWLGEIVLGYIVTVPSSSAIFGMQEVFNIPYNKFFFFFLLKLEPVTHTGAWYWDPRKHTSDYWELFIMIFLLSTLHLPKFHLKLLATIFWLPVIIYSGYLHLHLWGEKKFSWIPWVMAFA